jgi:hypothetical protein
VDSGHLGCEHRLNLIAGFDALDNREHKIDPTLVDIETRRPDGGTPEREARNALILEWFSNPKAKKEVSELLAEYHLDESAIEAEAIRSVFQDLAMLDNMLTSLESRRNKALRCIADYQDRFAKQVREVSNRVIEGKAVVQLENRSARRSA